MNKRIYKILTVFILLFLLTGCTKTLKDDNKKAVTYDSKTICNLCGEKCKDDLNKYNKLLLNENLTTEELKTLKDLEVSTKTCNKTCDKQCKIAKENSTGQILTSNILCKPTNEDVILIYKLNDINVDKLSKCEDYKVNDGGYEGLWTSFFVKPLAWLVLKVGSIIKNYGLSLMLVSLLLRIIMMPLTKSTALQSENMKKAQPEIKSIDKKYEGKTDQDSVMKKSQETMIVYKRYGINPLSSCLFAMLQIPLLFAFIEAINRTPAIFEGNLLGFKLGMTPMVAFSRGEWWYVIIIILLAVVTYFSFVLNKTASAMPDNQKQMDIMNKILMVFIIFMSLSLSTAIAIYWITSSAFTVFQNLVVKRSGK